MHVSWLFCKRLLFLAIQSLRARAWFPKSVRDIRAFRVEQWSDFTAVVKGTENQE
jgi:virulence-associated protein VapD